MDFWEDYFEQNPLEVHRNEDGQIQFQHTGDDLIDKWEKELAEGKMPDYMEGFSTEQLEKLDRMRTHGTDQFNRTIRDTAMAFGAEANSLNKTLTVPLKRFKDVDD